MMIKLIRLVVVLIVALCTTSVRSQTPFWIASDGAIRGDGRSLAIINDSTFVTITNEGIFRTSDTGRNWLRISSLPEWWMSHNPGEITVLRDGSLLATGTNPSPFGIWKSIDTGVTWKEIPGTELFSIWTIREVGRSLLAAGSGLYESKDNDTTWSSLNLDSSNRWFTGVAVLQDSTLVAYNDTALYVTHNSDGIWTKIIPLIPFRHRIEKVAKATAPILILVDSMCLYTANGDTGYLPCGSYLESSVDFGKSWQELEYTDISYSVLPDGSWIKVVDIYGSPPWDDSIARSTDNGVTWHKFSDSVGSPLVVTKSGMLAYFTKYNNFMVSYDLAGCRVHQPETFGEVARLIPFPNGSLLDVHYSNSFLLSSSSDHGMSWHPYQGSLTSDEADKVLVDSKSVFYLPVDSFGVTSVLVSTDLGNIWSQRPTPGFDFIALSGDVLYGLHYRSGINQLYRSVDEGLTWEHFANVPQSGVKNLAVDPPRIICDASEYWGDSVYVSMDGTNWSAGHGAVNASSVFFDLKHRPFLLDFWSGLQEFSDTGWVYRMYANCSLLDGLTGDLYVSQAGCRYGLPRYFERVNLDSFAVHDCTSGLDDSCVTGIVMDADRYLYAFSQAGIHRSTAPMPTGTDAIKTQHGDGAQSSAYPNPSSGLVRIAYQLPAGVSSGEVILTDEEGREVKRYRVTSAFSDLEFQAADLPSGSYFYRVLTSEGESPAERIVLEK